MYSSLMYIKLFEDLIVGVLLFFFKLNALVHHLRLAFEPSGSWPS